MSYRTILVQLETKETSKDLLSISIALAQQHNAHLIGMYVTPTPQFYVSSELPAPVELIERYNNYHLQLRDDLKKNFEHATANSDFVSEWREINTVATSVAQADSGSDLLVMGAYGHARIREYVFGGVTRKILYEMPIPVLMSH